MKTETVPLGEACIVVMGQSPPGTSYNTSGDGLPFFQGKIDFGEIHPKVRVFCNQPARIAEEGDILISVRAPVGPTNLAKEKCCIGRGLAALRAGTSLDTSFLFYFLRHCEPRLASQGQGSTFNAINRDDLEEIQVPLPSLSEQQRIAAQLEQADQLVRTRRYALELTDSFLPAVFLELFGDPLTLMRRWDRKPFGDLLAEGLRNGLSPSNAGKVTARVLTLSAITRGFFDSSSSKLAPFVVEPPTEKRVCSMDFLICRGNGNLGMVGRGRYPLHDVLDCVFPDTMIAARIKPDMICKQFLEAVWESPALRKQIEASARTTNGTHKINQGVIEETEIPLPPLPLQHRFAAMVEQLERLRTVQREALRQAEHLFDTLLHRAFADDETQISTTRVALFMSAPRSRAADTPSRPAPQTNSTNT